MDEEEYKNNCKEKAQYKCKSGMFLLFRAVLGFHQLVHRGNPFQIV